SITPFAYGAGSWKPLAGDWDFPNTDAPALGAATGAADIPAPLPDAATTAVPDRLDSAVATLLAASASDRHEIILGASRTDPAARAGRGWLPRRAERWPPARTEAAGAAAPSRAAGAAAEAAAWLVEWERAAAQHRRDLDDLFASPW